jgi:HAD superfamily hydrolase (TIGR01549 family)
MRYAAIFFDLDNTLYDYDAYWRQRLAWSLEPVKARYPGLNTPLMIENAIAGCVYARHFDAFLSDAGITNAAVRAQAVERYRINSYSTLQLYPEARPVLLALRQHARLGLITNGPAHSQRPKIEQFGLADLMDVIIVSEEVQLAKPDPAIFRLALERLDVAPQQALYVGDSLRSDLMGAHAVGMDFIWMNPQRHELPPDLPPPLARIARLTSLYALLGVPPLAGARTLPEKNEKGG